MAMGVSEERFWEGTPNDLECYAKADMLKRKRDDEDAYRNGLYTISAVSVVIDRAFNGRQAKAKYFTEPILATAQKEIDAERAARGELSQIEQTDYVDKFFRQLEIMGHNFKMTHKDNSGGER